ncbi:glycerol:H+ symporter-like protein [Sporormia fimetaria CBS 119925]|uniref:Glycerol:H+ symporter-like protein n=1 Tax=Sporormia fimetaria CBS 119925 TaxID=1340428 RepID=A0A6A6VPY5_9PLEO|nr:glycerol:H+ symporter-like protein [Sporormia fimetaria CBS 119925]
MSLQDLRRLFAVETLDTRFVIPANAPPREVLKEIQQDSSRTAQFANGGLKGKNTAPDAEPSRWNTPEYYLYYLVFLICVPLMFKSVYDVSKESHPNYPRYARLLSNGWIPGRKVDNSDQQYAGFRGNFPYLVILLILHPLLRRAYDSFWRAGTYTQTRPSSFGAEGQLTQGLTTSAAAKARLQQRMSFDIPFSAIFIFALHGFSAFKILAILYMNYALAKKLPKKYLPAATWIFNVGILFANELCRGYSYGKIVAFLLASPVSEKGRVAWNFGHTLDRYGGLLARWDVHFNFTVLRLISFNLDYYWSLNSGTNSPLEKKQLDPTNLPSRTRITLPHSPSTYTFLPYLSYTLYAPLYLAGPIITFNDYISQLQHPPLTLTTKRTLLYALRFLVCLLTMEIMIHYLYPVAIFHARPNWSTYTPFQLSMLAYFNLKHIWLKLLLPWRFFRLWAMFDTIDAPENMVRCMSDNFSVMRFWRGWHRSFNAWTLRYVYVPLGGSRGGKVRVVANYLLVFTFIAIWHDIQLRLLMWGWLVTVFVLPELLAHQLFPKERYRDRPETYRVLCGLGAVGEILLLMVANIVGFALGVDGLMELVKGIVGSFGGWVYFVAACATLFVGVQVMFEVREGEKRRGIVMRC